jgi:transposase
MENSKLTRLKEFRQLKKEIRGSEEHLIVGIDVAKEKHRAYFGTATGKSLLRKLVFDNSIEGFETLLHRTRAIMAQEGLSKVVYGVEPTADYHKPLGEFLIRGGQNLVLVSNGAVKQNRELLDGRWDKNDTKDSANVADLISQGKFLYYDLPGPEIRDLRNLSSLKRKLKAQEHSLRMRIRNHLVTQFFPELDKFYGRREGENLAIVKWCLNPSQIASMEFEKFFQMVTTRNMGESQR